MIPRGRQANTLCGPVRRRIGCAWRRPLKVRTQPTRASAETPTDRARHIASLRTPRLAFCCTNPKGKPLSSHPYTEHLRGVPLFSKLSDGDLERIATVATELRETAGKTLLREGSAALEMFVVLDGELEVTREGQHVANLGPGAFAGELALLAHAQRSSTVTCTSDTTILHIDGRAFGPLLEDAPHIAVKMLPIVAQRAIDNATHQV